METIQNIKAKIKKALVSEYDEGELREIISMSLCHYLCMNKVDLIINETRPIPEGLEFVFEKLISRLSNHEPIQYILGEAEFHGHTFKVTPHTLIPRPETAQLVDIIIDDFASQPDLKIIDIGTGSGCIAISLARALKFANIDALDISDSALKVAQENASKLKTKINFLHGDILSNQIPQHADYKQYDIIVSNPPYIVPSEQDLMNKNVLNFEPHTALFVPENDPLIFYRAITNFAQKNLKPTGSIYFEINPLFCAELGKMLESFGASSVTIYTDFYARNRFIKATF